MKALSRFFNRLARPLARTGLIAVWGVVVHVGRRSGRRFETPVVVVARGDEFFVPLPYGEGTDWCRNILAAGGGIVRYRGHDHEVREPRVVNASVGATAFPRITRPILPRIGVRTMLHVRRARPASRAA